MLVIVFITIKLLMILNNAKNTVKTGDITARYRAQSSKRERQVLLQSHSLRR